MPIPIPENLTPLEPPYAVLVINQWWSSLAQGLLSDALGRWNWEVDDLEWPGVEQAVIELMTALSSCEPICGITLNSDGTITINQGGIDTILPITDAILPDVQTPAGPNPEASYPEDSICSGATQLVIWLLAIADNVLDEMAFYWAESKTRAEAILAIGETITLGLLELFPLDEIYAITSSIDTEVISLGYLHIANLGNIERWTKALYCRIRDNGDEFTLAVWEAWLAEDVNPDNPSTQFGIEFELDRIFASVEYKRARAKYALWSFDAENDCRLQSWCDGECVTHDFGDMDQYGWTPHIHSSGQPNAVWQTDHWEAAVFSTPSEPTRWRHWFRLDSPPLPLPQKIRSIEITYDHAPCGVCDQTTPTHDIVIWFDGEETRVPVEVEVGTGLVTRTEVNMDVDLFWLDHNLGWKDVFQPNGQFWLHKVKVCFEGDSQW